MSPERWQKGALRDMRFAVVLFIAGPLCAQSADRLDLFEKKWLQRPLARFILAKLAAKSIPPPPPAAKLILLRRATFDLTGLPPTLKEIDSFLADNSHDAFAKVVDRLLASPQYGENWGRHW